MTARTPVTWHTEPLPEAVNLATSGLLSKWGFGDGDVLWDLLFDLQDAGELTWPEDDLDNDPLGFAHRVLSRVVEEYVVPRLDQQVETFRICTIHNPIRAKTVDGEEWRHPYEPQAGEGVLTPEYVEVPMSFIRQVAAEEADR